MDQQPNMPVAQRAQRQQRRDIADSLEHAIEKQLLAAQDRGAALDLELVLNAGIKRHIRVAAISAGVLTGIALVGFTDDRPRQQGGEIAIRVSAIAMIEQIIGPASQR